MKAFRRCKNEIVVRGKKWGDFSLVDKEIDEIGEELPCLLRRGNRKMIGFHREYRWRTTGIDVSHFFIEIEKCEGGWRFVRLLPGRYEGDGLSPISVKVLNALTFIVASVFFFLLPARRRPHAGEDCL